jgi:hypothetical protein
VRTMNITLPFKKGNSLRIFCFRVLHNATLTLDSAELLTRVRRTHGWSGYLEFRERQRPHFKTIDATKQMSASSVLAVLNS